MNYWRNLAASLSQVINALRGGNCDITVSSRTYKEAWLGPRRDKARKWERRINWFFSWLEDDHCRRSFGADIRNRAEVEEWRKAIERARLTEQQRETMK